MGIPTYEMAKSMLDAIPALHDEVGAYCNTHLGKPFPNAPAVAEMVAFRDPEIIGTAYSQGSILVEVAVDHLMAFTKTMTEPVETFAPWVSVRAVLEAGALAAWSLDPAIHAQERAKRSFAFRYEGLTELVKFLRASKSKQADVDSANKRIDDVEDEAIRLGFPKLRDKNRKRNGIGMPMPSVTQLISQVFDDEPTYRLLSAMAHGHHGALQQLGYKRHEDNGKSDYVKLKKYISFDSIGYLSARTVRAFVRPIWYKSRQNGWDMERLRGILESAYDAMRLNEKDRFWRAEGGASATIPGGGS
jgi:hypothetical protein